MPLAPGTRVADYTVLKKLGEGGMGEVYLCVHQKLGHQVVVKGLRAFHQGNQDLHSRFAREAEVMERLKHPNIVKIFNFVETEDGAFIIMEYVAGVSFDDVITKRGRISPEEAIELMKPVLSAVQFAHEQGVIHRDLKPSNFMLGYGGEVRVLDFGTAKLVDQPGLTRAGTTLGTANYMSPEQIYGRELGPQTDVYALGVCLYEMVTGRLPFEAEATSQLIGAIIVNEATPPSTYVPDLPRPLERVIMTCLAKKPEGRYQSAQALSDALDLAYPPPPPAPAAAPAPATDASSGDPSALLASIKLRDMGALPTVGDAKLYHGVGVAGVVITLTGLAIGTMGAVEPGLGVGLSGLALLAYAITMLRGKLRDTVLALDEMRRSAEHGIERARQAVIAVKMSALEAGPLAGAGGGALAATGAAGGGRSGAEARGQPAAPGAGDSPEDSGARLAKATPWRYAPLDSAAARQVTQVFDSSALSRQTMEEARAAAAPAFTARGTAIIAPLATPDTAEVPAPGAALESRDTAEVPAPGASLKARETEEIPAPGAAPPSRKTAVIGTGEGGKGTAMGVVDPSRTAIASRSEILRILKDRQASQEP